MKRANVLLYIGILVYIASCHNDAITQQPPIPLPDPCVTPVSQRHFFTIANQVDDKFFPSDTIFPGTVRLSAPSVYTSVTWQVGNDARIFIKNNQLFDFTSAIGTIYIRFIGVRPVDACIPKDRGSDTLTKALTIVPYNYRHPRSAIEGIYLGANVNAPQDTFSVRIFNRYNPRDTTDYAITIYNLNKGCPGLDMNVIPAYKALKFNQTRGDATCHGVYGVASLDSVDRRKLKITYNEQLVPGQPEYAARVFIGYRKK